MCCIQMEDPEEHRDLRSVLQQFFSAENIAKVLGQLCIQVSSICDALQTRSGDAGSLSADVVSDLAYPVINATITKVLFETEQPFDLSLLLAAFDHMGEAQANPLRLKLIRLGLLPGYLRYRRNWRNLHAAWESLLTEAYTRPLPPDSSAFWACLRRRYPAAEPGNRDWEKAISNAGFMCDLTVCAKCGLRYSSDPVAGQECFVSATRNFKQQTHPQGQQRQVSMLSSFVQVCSRR